MKAKFVDKDKEKRFEQLSAGDFFLFKGHALEEYGISEEAIFIKTDENTAVQLTEENNDAGLMISPANYSVIPVIVKTFEVGEVEYK